MAVKIRLQRHGRKKAPFYHIVVADARAPRDGRFIEKLGTYNPMTVPATIELDRDKAYDWLLKGAQPTYTARAILRFKGVLYRKHLMRGVSKGALTQEQADEMYAKWIEEKEAKVSKRREQEADKRKQRLAEISGKPKKVQTPEPEVAVAKSAAAPVAEEAKTFAESVEQTTVESFSSGGDTPPPPAEKPAPKEEAAPEEKPAEEPAPVAEETPAAEEAKEEPTPVAEEPTPPPPSNGETTADDLKKIEGIGPKIAELLTEAGIATFAQLAETQSDKIKEILSAAGNNFATHDPTTWPEQAKMAAEGKWDELKKWQDELDGGKDTSESKEEKSD